MWQWYPRKTPGGRLFLYTKKSWETTHSLYKKTDTNNKTFTKRLIRNLLFSCQTIIFNSLSLQVSNSSLMTSWVIGWSLSVITSTLLSSKNDNSKQYAKWCTCLRNETYQCKITIHVMCGGHKPVSNCNPNKILYMHLSQWIRTCKRTPYCQNTDLWNWSWLWG